MSAIQIITDKAKELLEHAMTNTMLIKNRIGMRNQHWQLFFELWTFCLWIFFNPYDMWKTGDRLLDVYENIGTI